MLINVLVRTSFRPEYFKRCLQSIYDQTHKEINIIVSYDNENALSYIPDNLTKIRVHKSNLVFGYDNYVNDLKEQVTRGYFFVLDDDEVLANNECISKVVKHLKGNYGLICQFSRAGSIKPSDKLIKQKRITRAKVGMPCLFLHHSLKNIAQLDGSVPAADFHWIKAVSRSVRLKFVPIVVAYCYSRGNGQME